MSLINIVSYCHKLKYAAAEVLKKYANLGEHFWYKMFL